MRVCFHRIRVIGLCLMTACVLPVGRALGANGDAEQAARPVEPFGAQAGLVVHVAPKDAGLAIKLARHQHDRALVHCLAADAEDLAKLRKQIAAAGVYGRVSADQGGFANLPYTDHLVNLLVVGDAERAFKSGLTVDEILRVLRPGGVAMLGGRSAAVREQLAKPAGLLEMLPQQQRWLRFRKPWPEAFDHWPQYDYGADGHRLSADTAVAAPTGIRWMEAPTRSRGHGQPPAAMVSMNGRLFYVYDEGTPYLTDPSRLYLTARDAFNGLVLWKKLIATYPAKHEFIARPRYGRRNLLAVGERLYATVKLGGPLAALDAGTGKLLKTYEYPPPRAVLYLDGRLILQENRIRVISPQTGELLWASAFARVKDTLAGDGKVFYYVTDDGFGCLSLADGKELWRHGPEVLGKLLRPKIKNVPGRPGLCFYRSGYLVISGRAGIHVFSGKDGRHLWSHHYKPPAHGGTYYNAFLHGGKIWLQYPSKFYGIPGALVGLDAATGKELSRFTYPWNRRILQKCHPDKATRRFLITGMMDFVGWDDGGHGFSHITRSVCGFGVLPANGSIYTFPSDCICTKGFTRGITALAAMDTPSPAALGPEEIARRLVKGPAYGTAQAGGRADAESWPMYRHDAARSGRSTAKAPARLEQLWQMLMGGRITSPVIAGGAVFVAATERHELLALDEKSGQVRWRFTAGGRIDTPPTVAGELCIFGGRDGRVYCLRARDGKLAWSFDAAPTRRLIVAYGQLESAWPVYGSILVDGDVAYVAAGRSGQADGGIALWALDATSGRCLWQKRVQLKTLNNLLVKSGADLYMGETIISAADGGTRQRGWKAKIEPVLTTSTTFLDPVYAYNNRWTYGQSFGQMMAFSGEEIISFSAFHKRTSKMVMITPGEGAYLLRKVAYKRGLGDEKVFWSKKIPLRVTAMAWAGDVLFVAGAPDQAGPTGGKLWSISADDGKKTGQVELAADAVFDGLAVAGGKLYLATADGKLTCYGSR